MVENSRKSNFNIGETAKIKAGGYAVDTSSNVAYNSNLLKSYDNAHALKMKENQMDYKQANFQFGSQENKYITTNKDEYTGKKMSFYADASEKLDRLNK